MEDVLFYQNYTSATDISAIAVCVVCWLLLGSTYTIKQKKLVTFNIGNALVCTAAISSISYHRLIERITENNIVAIYFFRNLTYISLILTFVVYIMYIKNFLNMNGRIVCIVDILSWFGAVVFIVGEIASPFIRWGFYIDENLQVHQNYYLDLFRFFYVYYVILIWGLMILNKMKFITKMYNCLRNVILISFLMMAVQDSSQDASLVCITFSLPILVVLFLFHYNAYDYETGTLDFRAFDAYIRDMKKKRFTMLYLYLKDPTPEKMHELTVEFYHFNERYFKNPCTFRLRDNKMALIYEDDKNKEAEQQIPVLIEDFNELYEQYQIDYRIVIIKSDHSLHGAHEYLALDEFLEGRMDINTVYFCKDKDIAAFGKTLYIMKELKDICEKGDMEDERVLTYCQPILNIEENVFTSAEVLMRLKLPDIGIVFPDQFIPLAEKKDYIHTLSKIILNKACKEMNSLDKKGYYLERISINFSVQELRDKNFSKDVLEIIDANNVKYGRIAIELTESRNETDFEKMKKVMNELHGLGMKFYLDDFGTGYSNFERIIDLPIDVIKFDRSLTLLAGKNLESRYLVGSFSEIFKKSEYQVLFEGVENAEDERICQDMQAHFLQGYKYSKPIPMEQLTEFLSPK